jgi:hypothetical protein
LKRTRKKYQHLCINKKYIPKFKGANTKIYVEYLNRIALRFLSLICFFILILTACNKGKSDVTIRGAITDGTFNGPLSSASVSLSEIATGGGVSNLIAQTTLGLDGSYSFTFPRNIVEGYLLVVEKNNYFTINENIPFSDLTIEEDNILNFSTTALSWAKLRFINLSPLPGDILRYIRNEGKSDCLECCTGGEHFLYGAIDTAIYCANDGNTTYSYQYYDFSTGNQGVRSTTTTAFDTTEILLNY